MPVLWTHELDRALLLRAMSQDTVPQIKYDEYAEAMGPEFTGIGVRYADSSSLSFLRFISDSTASGCLTLGNLNLATDSVPFSYFLFHHRSSTVSASIFCLLQTKSTFAH